MHANSHRHDALIREMLAAEDLPTLALDKADAFDYHFMAHLMGKLQASSDQAVRVDDTYGVGGLGSGPYIQQSEAVSSDAD
jgi:hypothetical protein